MAYKEGDDWVFDKKEVDKIFEKSINKKLKKSGSLTESEILEIGKELDVDALALRDAIRDVKSNVALDAIIGKRERLTSPGGTKGGFGSFIVGIIMAISGGYMLTNNIQVRSGFWGHRYGFGGFQISAFGATLIPLLIGIGLLFFDGKSKIGWVLTGGSILTIFVGIITNLDIIFQPTSLYVTMIMLVLLIGGIGLVARSLRSF